MLLLIMACSTHESVAVVAAPQARASYLTLTDGTIDTAHVGVYERPCGPSPGMSIKGSSPCVDLRFYVFPVRASEGPVRAWATCDKPTSSASCEAYLTSLPELSGRVVSRYGGRDSGWQKAMADALRRHNLSAVGNSPVIQPK